MSKSLQIRRGTTAAHENFTGMIGEVSFDTDAKTLRVHDGETLGGFALARADQITDGNENGNGFDVANIPDDFWRDIVERFAPSALTLVESPEVNLNTSIPYIECVFGKVNQIPAITNIALVCQSPEAGYAIGDEVSAFGIGNRTNPAPNTWVSYDQLHVRLMTGTEQFWVSNKNTGTKTSITPENWKLLFRLYC